MISFNSNETSRKRSWPPIYRLENEVRKTKSIAWTNSVRNLNTETSGSQKYITNILEKPWNLMESLASKRQTHIQSVVHSASQPHSNRWEIWAISGFLGVNTHIKQVIILPPQSWKLTGKHISTLNTWKQVGLLSNLLKSLNNYFKGKY